ncbi:MAG: hypothetical protein ACRDJE_07705, partial [Dehalococcoidia bacterium]
AMTTEIYIRLNRFIDMEWEALAASLKWFREEGLRVLERATGFRTIFFGVDPKKGRASGITFWASEGCLRQSESVEKRLGVEALARANADSSNGLVDRYQLRLFEVTGQPDAEYARLVRWQGLTVARLRSAFEGFVERDLPALAEMPGFSGIFAADDERKGKALSVIMWDSREALQASVELEREARARAEATIGPNRPTVADTYQVAMVPAVHALRAAA